MGGDKKNGLLGISGCRRENIKVDLTEILQEHFNHILPAADRELTHDAMSTVTKLWV